MSYVFHEYMRNKTLRELEEKKRKQSHTSFQVKEIDKKSKTQFNPIPDMRQAYRKVAQSGHIPTDGEIHYRRFTSGSYVDCE